MRNIPKLHTKQIRAANTGIDALDFTLTTFHSSLSKLSNKINTPVKCVNIACLISILKCKNSQYSKCVQVVREITRFSVKTSKFRVLRLIVNHKEYKLLAWNYNSVLIQCFQQKIPSQVSEFNYYLLLFYSIKYGLLVYSLISSSTTIYNVRQVAETCWVIKL